MLKRLGHAQKSPDRSIGDLTGNRATGDRLIDQIQQVWIVAYRENTDRLEQALGQANWTCQVMRQADRPDLQDCAAIHRCLLNHHAVWQQAAQAQSPTLIVEADFVPVVNLAKLPLPFAAAQPNVGLAWLYTCAPQLYSVTAQGNGEGFSTGLVAYIVTPQGARALLDFVEHIRQKAGTDYYNFDSEIDAYLRSKQLKNYIVFRNYGEHGGRSNPEHRRHGMSGIHRADVLADRLAFLPDYAIESAHPGMALAGARIQARSKGIARLLTGKFLRPFVVRTSSVPLRLLRFAWLRQLTLRL